MSICPTLAPTADRAHAKRSPSAYKYIKACPGYMPQKKQEMHPNTLRGIKVHEAIEVMNFEPLDDQELRWAEYCLQEKQKQISAVFGSEPNFTEHKEIKVEVSHRYQSWGFVDSFLISNKGDVGILLDWKFGYGEVADADENEQGKGYAVALYNKFPTLKKLVVVFVQPPIRKTTEITYTNLKAQKMLTEIEAYLKKGWQCDKNPTAFLKKYANPEPTMCLYCQRSKDLTCPIMAKALRKIKSNVDGLIFPSKFDPANLPSNPVDLVKILAARPLIDKIFDAATDRVKELLESGAEVPGVELQHVEGRTTVADAGAAKGVALTAGLTEEEFDNCTSVSLPDLKAVIKTKAPRGQKEIAVEKFSADLLDAGATKQGEPSTRVKILK